MKADSKSIVIADLPKAGLGNKLFVWAKAFVFAEQQQLQLYVKGLNRFHVGTFLRNEKVKRFYLGQFRFNPPSLTRKYFYHKLSKTQIVLESDGEIEVTKKTSCYVYHQLPHWSNLFNIIRDQRESIIPAFYKLLSKENASLVANDSFKPVIGMHIRMGDFKPLPKGIDFKNAGGTRTPLTYFKNCIVKLRQYIGEDLPVTIFSDGYPHELKEILDLSAVQLAPKAADIIDMIRLSKSDIIFTSAGSTFGEWAGFLSDAPVILHPDHIHARIRSADSNLFEGTLTDFINNKHMITDRSFSQKMS